MVVAACCEFLSVPSDTVYLLSVAVFVLHLSSQRESLFFTPFNQDDSAIDKATTNETLLTLKLAKSHCCDNTLELVLGDRFLIFNRMNLDSLIPASCNDIFFIWGYWHTCYGPAMSFVTENQLKWAVEKSKLSVFRNRSEIFARCRELHRVDCISVVSQYSMDFPCFCVPYDDAWILSV